MVENIHRVRTLENKGNKEFERQLEEWKKNKDFSLGVRTPDGAFERIEVVQTSRNGDRPQGSKSHFGRSNHEREKLKFWSQGSNADYKRILGVRTMTEEKGNFGLGIQRPTEKFER